MILTATCQVCGQLFPVEVDDEAAKILPVESLVKLATCNGCIDRKDRPNRGSPPETKADAALPYKDT
jgi:hypothetical protein